MDRSAITTKQSVKRISYETEQPSEAKGGIPETKTETPETTGH